MSIINERLASRKEECKQLYLDLRSFRKVAKVMGQGITKDNVNLFIEAEFPEIICRKNILLRPGYFKQVDSHEKAYFLGFIAADGYLSKPEFKNRFLEITLQERDIIVLEKLKEELGASHTISFRPATNSVRLHIGNTELVSDIEKYGIFNAKSLTMGNIIENIPEEFKGSFITGLWDGDGCCGIYKRKNGGKEYMAASLVSTLDCIEGVREYLGIKGYLRNAKNHSPLTFTWAINGKADIEHFFHKTYKQCPFKLARKYDKFAKIGLH